MCLAEQTSKDLCGAEGQFESRIQSYFRSCFCTVTVSRRTMPRDRAREKMVRFVLRKDRDAQRPVVDDDDEDGDGDNKHNHRQRLDGQKMAHAPRTVCWIQRHTHTHTRSRSALQSHARPTPTRCATPELLKCVSKLFFLCFSSVFSFKSPAFTIPLFLSPS